MPPPLTFESVTSTLDTLRSEAELIESDEDYEYFTDSIEDVRNAFSAWEVDVVAAEIDRLRYQLSRIREEQTTDSFDVSDPIDLLLPPAPPDDSPTLDESTDTPTTPRGRILAALDHTCHEPGCWTVASHTLVDASIGATRCWMIDEEHVAETFEDALIQVARMEGRTDLVRPPRPTNGTFRQPRRQRVSVHDPNFWATGNDNITINSNSDTTHFTFRVNSADWATPATRRP